MIEDSRNSAAIRKHEFAKKVNATLDKLGLIKMNTKVGAFESIPMSRELSPTKLNRLQQSVERNVSTMMRNADPRASVLSTTMTRGASIQLARK